ncbi:MAG: hybrid sensor histidine kinase/response regulator [Melioribacter sp.]|nr:hybrid sensor histidine kinase/response regulator [Melioribacter sp.]
MDAKDEEFLKRLRATFRVEAEEHIQGLISGIIELEKSPKTEKAAVIIETIFRDAHSLKGAARSVNMKDVESICQELESIFGKLKNEKFLLTAAQFDLIHRTIDNISKMVSGAGLKTPNDNSELIKHLRSITEEDEKEKNVETKTKVVKKSSEGTKKNILAENSLSADIELVDEKLFRSETVRIPTAKLDPIFLQAEQMIQYKIAAAQRTKELKSINDSIDSWKKKLGKQAIHSTAEGGSKLKEIIDWNSERLNELEIKIAEVAHVLENDQRSLGRMIDDHLESMKNVLMLPISTIVEGFPKFVRDLSRSQGKEVELVIIGKEIEVDKRILEELKDPLIHLVRNCIDHGIKKPDERVRLNKPSSGKVTLSFNATESRHLEIIISDDGIGVDLDKVRSAALKSGMIAKDSLEKISTQEILSLIFQSGITTSQIITDISGRGLGLAIVREKAEKLGGSVSVDSMPNIGTTFRLFLPLTLSTLRGVIVRTGENLFVIPTLYIDRVVRVNCEEIKTVENKETIIIDGKIITTVNLGNVLGLVNKVENKLNRKNVTADHLNFIQLIILVHADKKIAFEVDEILEEYQILVKELGKQLSRVHNISGATILGSGKVIPVINVPDLMKSALRTDVSFKELSEKETETKKKYKILVIDDSITSRTLIKNIVETAGYIVETAVDGVDAFTKALIGGFDLLVSDVDMPRMNGFELTAKIRKEKKLSELPVVLVTALETREDREHGIDVGANAYIVKSSFDQSNLLEVIKKLL